MTWAFPRPQLVIPAKAGGPLPKSLSTTGDRAQSPCYNLPNVGIFMVNLANRHCISSPYKKGEFRQIIHLKTSDFRHFLQNKICDFGQNRSYSAQKGRRVPRPGPSRQFPKFYIFLFLGNINSGVDK